MIEAAGGAGLRGIAPHRDSFGADKFGDGAFDFGLGEDGHGAGVVGHGEENALGRDHGDADAIDFVVEQVGAMAGGVEPGLVDGGRVGADGDVFFDETEVRACLAGAGGEVGFAGVAMGDGALGGHAHAMLQGGVGEGLIPNETAAAFLLAGLVGEGKQLLGLGGLRRPVPSLGVGGRRGGEQKNGDGRAEALPEDVHVSIRPEAGGGSRAVFFAWRQHFGNLIPGLVIPP